MSPCAAAEVEEMRAVAAGLLAPDAPFLRQDELEERRLLLRRYLQQLVPAVQDIACTKPAESVPRAVALAEAESAQVLLTIAPEQGFRAAVQHVRHLARELRALCDQYDVLTGARRLGVGVGAGRLQTVSWCDVCLDLAEDVRRVQPAKGAPRPDWGSHACGPCRHRLGLASAPREPGKVVPIQWA